LTPRTKRLLAAVATLAVAAGCTSRTRDESPIWTPSGTVTLPGNTRLVIQEKHTSHPAKALRARIESMDDRVLGIAVTTTADHSYGVPAGNEGGWQYAATAVSCDHEGTQVLNVSYIDSGAPSMSKLKVTASKTCGLGFSLE
jgi:hypothetical protein